MTKPAIVEAKERIVDAVAGVAGGGFEKCLEPTPTTIM